MVILIGGVSCAGKTLMAQRLLERYKIPYLSIDHLKMGLYRATPHCGFTPLDSSSVIGEALWPILRGIIMTSIENKRHLIIEGCYLLPQQVMELDAAYLREVISFYLGFSPEYIQKRYHSAIWENRQAIEARDCDDDGSPEAYLQENQSQKLLCEAHGARYFEIDGDYAAEMRKVYEWLDGAVQAIDNNANQGLRGSVGDGTRIDGGITGGFTRISTG